MDRERRPLARHRALPGRRRRSSSSLWIAAQRHPGLPHFDPYTFIFLTLILSLQAAYSAPLILLAQNRQDDRDRVNLDEDRGQRPAAARGHRVPGARAGLRPVRRRRGRHPRLPALGAGAARRTASRTGRPRNARTERAPGHTTARSTAAVSPATTMTTRNGARHHDGDRTRREPGQPRAVEDEVPPVGQRLDDDQRRQQRHRQQLHRAPDSPARRGPAPARGSRRASAA